MKSRTTIRRHLKDLRTVVETSKDPCEQRIAYGMETAIRWATENTVGWPNMGQEAKDLAALLRGELPQPVKL